MANPFLWEKERNCYLFSIFVFQKRRELVGKSLSSLCSTSLQNLSACRRCHSLTETVYFTSLSFLGLISSFHNLFSCFWFFYLFFFYLRNFFRLNFVFTALLPTITPILYRIKGISVKQFSTLFLFFLLFIKIVLVRISRSHRQNQVLILLIFNIFNGERGNGSVKRQ